MQDLARVGPAPVQVCADVVAAIVAVDDTVRVEHRDDLEDEGLSQHLGLLVVLLQQEVDGPLYHEAGVALARMHSACQEDGLLLVARLLVAILVLGRVLEAG